MIGTRVLCVYVGTHLQHVTRQLTILPQICLPPCADLQGQTEVRSQGFLRSFLNIHTELYRLPNSQEYIGNFQRPSVHILQLFILSLSVIVGPNYYSPLSGGQETNQLLLIVSDGCPGFSHWARFKQGQIKTALQVGSSRDPPDKSRDDGSLGRSLQRSSNLILSLPEAPDCYFSL